jgi:hypothetical protein
MNEENKFVEIPITNESKSDTAADIRQFVVQPLEPSNG